MLIPLLLLASPAESSFADKWVGRKVWPLGASAFRDDGETESWDPRTPVAIVSIRPIKGKLANEAPTSAQWPIDWGPRSVETPLQWRVRFRLPSIRVRRHPIGVGLQGPLFSPPFRKDDEGQVLFSPAPSPPGPAAKEAWIEVAGERHLARVVSQVSPDELLRKEPARIRDAFAHREVVKGMPRPLVARLLGDPQPGEPFATTWSSPSWQYYGMTPFSYMVVFDRRGRVRSSEVIGDLP